MNPVKTLLKFSLPRRTVMKKLKYSSSSTCCNSSPTHWKQHEPGFVTLSCTNRTVHDYTLSYTDGSGLVSKTCFCPQYHRMTNSCNGLVGVYSRDIFWIANPSFANCKDANATSIMRENGSDQYMPPQAAIGFDPYSTKYKVVELLPPYGYHGFRSGHILCNVMTMAENERRWWLIDEHPPTGIVLMEDQLPVAADGFVYWTLEPKYSRSKFDRPAVALSFDLAKEEFSVVFHPEGYSRDGISRLVDLGGRPCLADTRSGRMTVWALEDRWNSEWVKRCDVDLSRLDESKHFPRFMLTPLAIDDERVVLYYGQSGRREYYDIPTMSFLEHETVDNVDLEFVAPYAGSYVSPQW